ncbi:hypothetical protein niasHS_017517 [Heterodera schachtii]|uniref:Phospholipid/glycerol acyltransferase domain-containing protein n=1 Tax=Heterodera schachtii TaxID=97005 RepID=A0ABD2IH04_HETSC
MSVRLPLSLLKLFLVRFVPNVLSALRGFLFALIVFATSVFGNYIVTLFLPLITVLNHHRQWRQLMDRAISFWMLIPLFFLHFVFRVRIRATGDQIYLNKPAIIVMNHRTRLDWFYFWLVLWRMNPWLMTTNRIALKQLLRHIPGAGFGMQGMVYVFLRRDLETDSVRMSRAVDYYADMGQSYQILMFPEGTDKTPSTTARSDQFADRQGLPRLRHVCPSGFVHLAKKMRERNYLAYVYDVTVAYPGKLVQNETDMILRGRLAKNVHFDVKRISAEGIPLSDGDLHQWLTNLWTEKEERLGRFYSERIPSRRRFEPAEDGDGHCWPKDGRANAAIKVFGFCFWVSVVPVWLYHLTFLPFVQIGFAFLLFNYVLIYTVYGGIDELIMSKWERQREKETQRKRAAEGEEII